MDATQSTDHNRRAALLFLIACFFLSLANVVNKFIIGEINYLMLLFIRSASSALIVGAVIFIRMLMGNRVNKAARKMNILNVVDGMLTAFAMITFFIGLKSISVTEAVCITFMAPIFVVLFSFIILGENITIKSSIALLISFAAIVMLTKPSMGVFNIGTIYIMLAAMFWSLKIVFKKKLNIKLRQSKYFVMFYPQVVSMLFSFFLVLGMEFPEAKYIFYVFCSAVVSLLGNSLTLCAATLAPMRTIMPIDFSRLIITSVLGYICFGEVLSYTVLLAGLMIFYAGMLASSDQKE